MNDINQHLLEVLDAKNSISGSILFFPSVVGRHVFFVSFLQGMCCLQFLVKPAHKMHGQSYMGVEPKIGGFYPPKWMVKIMENPMKIHDLGVP